jgi:hypothetical protein
MPYGDKEKQKLYQQLYYQKYIRKPTLKRGGNLKIDLMNLKPEPLKDVRNLTLNHYSRPLQFYNDDFTDDKITEEPIDFLDKKGNLKTTKQIKKELDERITNSKSNKTVRKIKDKRTIQPSKPLLKSINLYENDYITEDTDDYEDVKPPKALEYYSDKESYLRNPFLLKIQDEPAFNYQVKEDIPKWIKKMTDDKIIQRADELSSKLNDEEVDRILDYCSRLFGMQKSRTKREYVLKELYKAVN